MNLYLRTLIVAIAAAFLLMATLNFALDPLGYFRNHGWHNGAFVKDRVWADERLLFDLSTDSYQPDTLIAGNSRVRHGFPLKSGNMPGKAGTSLKLGVRGAEFDELDRYIRRILRNKATSTLVIGLDLGQFLRSRDHHVQLEQARQINSAGILPESVKNLVTALWSRNAFLASASAMLSTHVATLDGSSNIEVMRRQLDGVGHRALTRRVETRAVQRHPIFDSKIHEARLRALSALLADTCSEDISVRLFISPLHVRQLLIMREIGHLGLFSAWKTRLVDLVSQHSDGGCGITLTDFSGISSYTSEPFPAPGDKETRMRWYWESSHYTHTMGRLMIDRLWENPDHPAEFGKNLTRDNITIWLTEQHSALTALTKQQPALVQEIRQLRR